MEYTQWWEGHEDICNANYSGSTPAMEMNGVVRRFELSILKNSLHFMKVSTCYQYYTAVVMDCIIFQVIGDSDAKPVVILMV